MQSKKIICITIIKFNVDQRVIEYVYSISTGTDWYFTLYSIKGIYSICSRTGYKIPLMEDALVDSTELCKNVKRILVVIVDKKGKKKKELYETLKNMAHVLPTQLQYITFKENSCYIPVKSGCGVIN
jgi:hypothetical protein